jgi:hypothetical protein
VWRADVLSPPKPPAGWRTGVSDSVVLHGPALLPRSRPEWTMGGKSRCPFGGEVATVAGVQLEQRSGDIDPELWFPCSEHEGERDILYPSSGNTFRGRAGLVRAQTGQLSREPQ